MYKLTLHAGDSTRISLRRGYPNPSNLPFLVTSLTLTKLDHASSLPPQRLKKYLYRKGRKGPASAHSNIPGPTIGATPANPSSNVSSNPGMYESICPYRSFDKKYRFFEEFSE
jgi:hypothetical protein